MALTDRMMVSEPREASAPGFLWPTLICIGTILLAGIFAGHNAGLAEAGKPSLAPWGAALIAVALGAVALTFYLRRHVAWLRALSPRRRRYWFSLGFAAVVGGIIGGWLTASQPRGVSPVELLTAGALAPASAVGAAIIWSLGLGIAMIIYHRSIDDHEQRAWLWASTWGWYAFIFTTPVWWVLHRAALAPAPDAMLLFLLSMAANGVVYLWLKFR